MDILGWIFVVAAVIGLVVGLVKGFIDQLLGFIATIAALIFSAMLCKYPEQWLAGLIENQLVRTIVAFIITAFVIIAVITIIKWLISKLLAKVKVLKILDKILGAALGAGIVYAVFGVLFAFSTAAFDAGAFDSIVKTITGAISESAILQTVYGNFNPLGQWIVNLTGLVSAVQPEAAACLAAINFK